MDDETPGNDDERNAALAEEMAKLPDQRMAAPTFLGDDLPTPSDEDRVGPN